MQPQVDDNKLLNKIQQLAGCAIGVTSHAAFFWFEVTTTVVAALFVA
jgi:hypothetical protein